MSKHPSVQLAIDPEREKPISFSEARKLGLFPREMDLSTLWRWATKGRHGVKLETIVIGGFRYTSIEAVKRFIQATTIAGRGSVVPTPIQSPARRRAKVVAAERRLALSKI